MSKGTSEYAITVEADRRTYCDKQFQESEQIVSQVFDCAEALLSAGNTQEVNEIQWFVEKSLLNTFTGSALAEVLERIAKLDHREGERSMPMNFLRQAIAIREQSARSGNREDVLSLCKSLERLAELYIESKGYDYARPPLKQSLDLRLSLNDSPENIRLNYQRQALCHFEHGKELSANKQWEPAQQAFQQSLELLSLAEPQAGGAQVDRATILRHRSECAFKLGDFANAVEAYLATLSCE